VLVLVLQSIATLRRRSPSPSRYCTTTCARLSQLFWPSHDLKVHAGLNNMKISFSLVAVVFGTIGVAVASPVSPSTHLTTRKGPPKPPGPPGPPEASAAGMVGKCPVSFQWPFLPLAITKSAPEQKLMPLQTDCWNQAAADSTCDPNADDECLCGPFFDDVSVCTSSFCSIGENLGTFLMMGLIHKIDANRSLQRHWTLWNRHATEMTS
jgi:hypothetical protein